MPQSRQTSRITRPNRPRTPERRRQRQPGSYTRAWDHTDAAGRSHLKAPVYASTDEVPADLMQRACAKFGWISAFVRAGCPYGTLKLYARAYADATEVTEVPPYTTLVEWAHRYRQWGILGLVDRVRADAGYSRVLSEDEEALLEIGLLGGKLGVSNLTALLASHTRRDRPVSYDVVYRWVQDYTRANRGLLTLAHEGRGAYQDAHRLALQTPPMPAGQRYTVDSTVADIWIRVPDLEKPGAFKVIRPVLTIVQDVGSRAVLSLNLSMYPISSAIIAGLFRRVLRPETNYAGMPALGVPEEVVADCGAEHLGQFQKALRHLGVRIIHGPADTPEKHPHVERIIGTCTTELLSTFPGYSATMQRFDPIEAPDADGKRSAKARMYEAERAEVTDAALLTIEQLESRLVVWATAYNHRPHPGLSIKSRLLRELLDAQTSEWQAVLADPPAAERSA